MGAGRTGRRATWAVALAVGAVLVGQPALADEGLSTQGRSRYVLDPKATTVTGTITIDLRNTTPSRGGFFYYYDGFTVPVPAGATRLRARSGGSALSVSLKPSEDPSTRLARISFPNLLYGRTRTITLTFRVPGEKPRAEDSTRVGPGYASFAVYGVGDAGRNTVEVVAPTSMTFDATSDDFTATQRGATTTHSSTASSDGGGSWAVVSLRDPERTDERTVEVNGVSVKLDGFQDDPSWGTFVAGQVTKGIPALEKLVGAPWPGGLERIREDASPTLRGYDGWFDATDDEIVIGEQLDADLVLHELSHAWVSEDRFEQRWISEGLAQVLAERAVEATGGTPAKHPEVSPGSRGAVALNSWGGSASSRAASVDDYAYPAAYAATTALVGRLDDAQLSAVLSAGVRGERAYDPAGSKDAGGGRTDWRRWLDLLQTRAGVEDAAQVVQDWALTTKQRAALAPRATARTAYAEVDAADGSWLPPEGLRDAMTEWDFARAAQVRTKVAGLGAGASAVQAAAQRAGIRVPDAVRASYERAASDVQYAALATTLPQAAAAITAVGDAQRTAARDRDPLSAVGATVLDVEGRADRARSLLDQGEYARATTAAGEVTSRSDRALLVGLALPVMLLLLLAGAVVWWRRRRAARARRRTEELERLAAVTPADQLDPQVTDVGGRLASSTDETAVSAGTGAPASEDRG
ncbi:MAG: hypothetical protein ACJ72B_10550 [Ornithinibacter sp.]